MASSKQRTTTAKRVREAKLRERRFEKQARKDARKQAREEGVTTDSSALDAEAPLDEETPAEAEAPVSIPPES